MAAHNFFGGALQVQAAAKPVNPVAASKMRDLERLWDSGLRASLLSNISDPLTDEAADLQAKELIAMHVTRNQHISKQPELADLIRFQTVLQTSSRALSRIVVLTAK